MVQNSAGVKYDNPIDKNMSPNSNRKYNNVLSKEKGELIKVLPKIMIDGDVLFTVHHTL